MELEEKLVQLRKEKGLTQLDLAEAVRVSRQAVSKWETGKAIPTTENLKYLSEVFGVPVDYLLNESAEEPVKEEAVPEKESAGDSAEKFSGNAPKSTISWKYMIAILLLAALLAGVCIGMFIGSKHSDGHISIKDIPGEEVDRTPDGEFYIGW